MSDLESEVQRRGLIKVSSDRQRESPYRRVAKFLYLVGETQAAKVLQKLTREQIEKVVAEMLTIRSVDKDEAAYILSEFTAIYNESKNSIGGVETAETILHKAFGKEKAAEILKKAVPAVPEKPFEFLDGVDGELLCRLLKDEIPATKVLVLSQLKPKTAAAYITHLAADEKNDIVLRLAKLDKISPEILRTISQSIREKLQHIQAGNVESVDGRAVLAAILRKSDSQTGEYILQHIADYHPDLEQDIRNRLFTFEDVLHVDSMPLQKKLSGMQDEELAALISYKPAAFVNKILANVSKNRASSILEEQSINPPSVKECRIITNQFLSDLRQQWEAGNLLVYGRDEIWID
ncbi:MAG: flagellar motor switch protein FliG [Treponema sp.]